ncbi:MAG: hypothetical protein LUG57_02040 [Oscillospiraceae bacterium]|nr:hypothetical protein [Oscillospiraceae bacterium]
MFRKIASATKLIKKFFEPPKNKWSKQKRIDSLMRGYLNDHGRELNIDSPKYFTEKLQWYKVNYCTKDMEKAVDKYLFKEYICEKLGEGYTIPILGAYSCISELKLGWNSLPETFILKSTLQSDGKNIKVIKKKSTVNFSNLEKELKTWFKVKNTLINSYCSAYYNAKPRIIAEEYLEYVDNQLYDYKFYCFQGQPAFMYVAIDHFKNEKISRISFYDLGWRQMDVTYGEHPHCNVDRPKHFEEMILIASVLAKDFPFVRVDFFDTDEKLYVAELTFYPGGGNTPYYPLEFDLYMGERFVLPETNICC